MEMKERTIVTVMSWMLFTIVVLDNLWKIVDGLIFGNFQQVVVGVIVAGLAIVALKIFRFFLRCWTFDDDDED